MITFALVLIPSSADTYPDEYLISQQALPIRQFSADQLESILTKFKQFIPIEINDDDVANDDEIEEEYINHYEAEFIIEDIAENANGRIVEVLYLQLYTSWGTLLAENKEAGQWTSFYMASGGDSKQYLYFNDEVELELELVGDDLIGSYSVYGDQTLAISLDDFTVQKVSP